MVTGDDSSGREEKADKQATIQGCGFIFYYHWRPPLSSVHDGFLSDTDFHRSGKLVRWILAVLSRSLVYFPDGVHGNVHCVSHVRVYLCPWKVGIKYQIESHPRPCCSETHHTIHSWPQWFPLTDNLGNYLYHSSDFETLMRRPRTRV